MTARARAELALAATTLIWGCSFVVVKLGVADISPLLYLAMRFVAATLILAVWLRGTPRGGWRDGVIAGLLLFAGCVLQTIGLRYTTPAKAAFLTSLYLVIVPMLSAITGMARPRPREWMGVAAATFGMFLLTLGSASMDVRRGDMLSVLCAFAFGVHIYLLGSFSPRNPARWLTFVQMVTCAAASLALLPLAETPFVRWTPNVILLLVFTSVLTTAAWAIQTWAQAYTTPTRATLIFALEPVIAAVISYFWLAENLGRAGLAGAGLILAGLLLIELKATAFETRRAAAASSNSDR